MEIFHIKSTGFRIAILLFMLLVGCQTPRPPVKVAPIKEKPSPVKNVKRTYHKVRNFFAVGNYVWLFYHAHFEVISNGKVLKSITYKSYKKEGVCVDDRPPQPTYKDKKGKEYGVTVGGRRPRTDCIPRFYSYSNVNYALLHSPDMFNVREREVIVRLGKEYYIFRQNGGLIYKENKEYGWSLKEGPYAGLWRWENYTLFFHDKKIDVLERPYFSGRWVLIKQWLMHEDVESYRDRKDHRLKILLLDRKTGEVVEEFIDNNTNTDTIQIREYGEGFYLDRYLDPSKLTEDGKRFFPIIRPMRWFGDTIINLENEPIDTYCYVYQNKKKCIPNAEKFCKNYGVFENEFVKIEIGTSTQLEIEFFPQNANVLEAK